MSVLRRLRNLFREDALAADIAREQRFHIEERAEELERSGVPRDEAMARARRQFGNPTVLRERTRDADVAGWLAALRDDVRYALRGLRAQPGFAAVIILSLSLGIGANTAIFSLVNAVMLRTLPVRDAADLVRVVSRRPSQGEARGFGSGVFTNPIWEPIREQGEAAGGTYFAYSQQTFDRSSGGERRPIIGEWASGGIFTVLGVQAAAGRLFDASDDVRGCSPSAVASYAWARATFGSADAAVGQSLSLDQHPVPVVGVTEPSFTGLEVGVAPAVYVTLCSLPVLQNDPIALDRRSFWYLQVMGRPAPGLGIGALQARLATIAPSVYGGTVPGNWGADHQRDYLRRTLWAAPAAAGMSQLRESYSAALAILFVVVGAVLLIGCANVANLLLARATTRRHEMAVRLALGAGRGRLVRQLLTESLVLAGIAAALGIVFARWAAQLLVRLLTTGQDPVWLDLAPDARVLAFTAGVAVLTAVLFGLAPAWRATRVDPQQSMRAQGRGVVRARVPLARALVVLQVALSLVLVVGAGLFLGSFRRLVTLDPGFHRDGVLVASVDLSGTGLDSGAQRQARWQLLEQMRALPGTRDVAASYLFPLSGSGWNEEVSAGTDTAAAADMEDRLAWFNSVSPGYFRTLGTALRAGRDFQDADRQGAAPVVIVNEALARKLFRGTSPLGQALALRRTGGGFDRFEIVGVVENARYGGLDEPPQPSAYLPMAQSAWFGDRVMLLARAGGDPMALAPAITRVLAREQPRARVGYVTLSQQVAESIRRPRLLATVSGFFGILALILAVVGLYGTMAYGVAQRRNEIGVRIALGAPRERVLRMVLGEAAVLVAGGAALGLGGALLATRFVKAFLFGLAPNDPVTLGASVVLLALAALGAAGVPAWRAARVDPAETLRAD